MNEEEIEKLLRESGAFLKGHFLLTSGKHSDQYIEKIKLVQNPKYVEAIIAELIPKIEELDFDCVASPAMGAIVLGYELAREMGKKFVFAQRKKGKMFIRSGFDINEKTKVLILEDIVTTGGSVREVVNCIKNSGAQIQGIAFIVDRSAGNISFDYPTISLLQMDVKTYEPESCPLCGKGITLNKPGASGKFVNKK